MAFTPDHSGNFPHEFFTCPKCEKKGVYRIRPDVVFSKALQDFILLSGEIYRCKYCKWQTRFKHEVHDLSPRIANTSAEGVSKS